MRIFVIALIAVAVIIAGLFIFKNAIARVAVQGMFERITGAPMKIGVLTLSLSKSTVDARNVTIFNPPSYPDRLMASLPRFSLDVDIGAYFQGRVHIRQLRLDLATLQVERNRQAQLNLESLRALQPKGEGKPPEVTIDSAEVFVGTVAYRDYTLGSPLMKDFRIDSRQTYSRITDPYALVNAIVATAIRGSGLARSLGLDLAPLEKRAGKELEKLKSRFGIPVPQ